MKHFYYVIVQTDKQAKFVTKIENATKYVHWDKNEKPLKLAKSYAQDLAYCLNLNFYPAFVIESFHEITEQIFIKENDNNDD